MLRGSNVERQEHWNKKWPNVVFILLGSFYREPFSVEICGEDTENVFFATNDAKVQAVKTKIRNNLTRRQLFIFLLAD